MDDKRPRRPAMSPIRGRSTRRSIYVFLALAALGAYAYLFDIRTLLPAAVDRAMLQSRPASGPGQKPVGKGAGLVPLEAHIMSKCPDARDCLRDLVLPAMQQVHDKVDFTLSYIGTPTENDGVDCKHGPAECLGNIIQLCALTLYPDPKIYLGFTMCLMRNYHDIPQRSLIEDCALEHAINFDKLNECATRDDGAFGIGLLRDSVKRSSEAGVIKSCTVRLNDEFYCIRDDKEWKDCPNGPGVDALVTAVEKLYTQSA